MHTCEKKFILVYYKLYLRGHCHGRVSFKAWNLIRHYQDVSLLCKPITKNERGREMRSNNVEAGEGLDSNNSATKGYVVRHNGRENVFVANP